MKNINAMCASFVVLSLAACGQSRADTELVGEWDCTDNDQADTNIQISYKVDGTARIVWSWTGFDDTGQKTQIKYHSDVTYEHIDNTIRKTTIETVLDLHTIDGEPSDGETISRIEERIQGDMSGDGISYFLYPHLGIEDELGLALGVGQSFASISCKRVLN